MPAYRIFCDFRLDEAERQFLIESIAPHELVVPSRPADSVLAQGVTDPAFATADIALGQPDPVAVLASPRLRWLQISTAGYTRYDTDSFRVGVAARGLVVSNSSDVFAEPCAEHVFAFMLAQSRSLPAALASSAANGSPEWTRLRAGGVSLRGRSLLILGYGYIARRLIELLAPFEMKIAAYRRSRRGDEPVSIVTAEGLPAALAGADHIVNILPDNAASRQFVDARFLSQVERGAVFYNIGRGTTVDQAALADALSAGQLSAAWLDVTDPEPLPADHPLRMLPNCFITPHTAGGHQDETRSLLRHFLRNLKRFEAGEPLRNRLM